MWCHLQVHAQLRPHNLPINVQTRSHHIWKCGRGQRSAVIVKEIITSCLFLSVRPLLAKAEGSTDLKMQPMSVSHFRVCILPSVHPLDLAFKGHTHIFPPSNQSDGRESSTFFSCCFFWDRYMLMLANLSNITLILNISHFFGSWSSQVRSVCEGAGGLSLLWLVALMYWGFIILTLKWMLWFWLLDDKISEKHPVKMFRWCENCWLLFIIIIIIDIPLISNDLTLGSGGGAGCPVTVLE